MSKPQPKKYRTTNWRDYNQSLKQRGAMLLWIDRKMDWLSPGSGKRGRSEKFSDAAIQFCLMVKNLFGVALRQARGMVASLLKLSGLANAGLHDTLPSPTASASLYFLSSQPEWLTSVGGQYGRENAGRRRIPIGHKWKTKKHGAEYRRQWRKVHLGIDAEPWKFGRLK